jgi:hypothetical protein
MEGSHKEPLSTDFQAIPGTLGPLDPERRKNLDVCIKFLERWHRFDVDGFADMMTADGILETPYRHDAMQKKGPEEIKEEYYKVMRVFGNHDCLWLEMHTTENPALFIYKSKSWNQVVLGPSKGNIYSNDYVVFMEVKGDKISRFTEYFNPDVTLASFDGDIRNWDIAIEEAAAAHGSGSAGTT